MPTLLERLKAFANPAPSRAGRQFRRFEAARVDRLTATWQAADTAIDQELRTDLRLLRRRARQMAKDNEYLKRFLSMVAANIVGSGMTLQSRPMDGQTMDNLAADAIERHWLAWCSPAECDIAGRSGFWTLMRTAVTALARDGELLLRLHRGTNRGTYSLQLQLLDIERLDVHCNRERVKGQNAIIMGVEVDQYHRPIAYHLLEALPTGLGMEAAGKHERVPADQIIHAFVPTDLEQTRGYPWAHAALRRLNDLQGYREAAVIAARVGAAKMGFFTSDQPDTLADGGETGEVPYTTAEPGQFGVLPPGTSFQSYDPQYPHDQFPEFIKATLRGIASALGVSYNTLASDLEGVNYSSIRSGVLEERDQWVVLQDWLIESVIDRVFAAWLQISLANGAITQITRAGLSPLPLAKIEKFQQHTFLARRWAWVDPLKDVQASIMAIEAGLTTATDVAAKLGVDIEDVLATKQREQQLQQQYGVELGSSEAAQSVMTAPDDQAEESPDGQAQPTAGRSARRTRPWDEVAARLDRLERALTTQSAQPIVVNNHVQPAAAPEVRVTNQVPSAPAPVVNVQPASAEVRVDAPAAPVINVAAPQVTVEAPIVNVAPAEVAVEAVIQPAAVQLELPARRTETQISRDASGRIASTTQIERDA